MSEYRIASRYAKSLLSLAIEQKIEDQLSKDMDLISNTCDENSNLVTILKDPIISEQKKLSILKRLFVKNINPIVARFLELLTRKNRANFLPEIARVWVDLYNDHKNILKARITTTTQLSEPSRKKVISTVQKATNKSIILEEVINKELIGGFILDIKDQRLDDSISGQLNDLRRKLINRV